MNAFRKILLATSFAVAALPGLSAAAQPAPPPPGQNQDVERRLEEARRRLEMAANEVADLSRQLGRNFAFRLGAEGGNQPRSLLGVSIDRNGQKDGAHVSEVSPGGAAAEAGIKAGDIITAIGGEDLTKESDPGRVLVDRMQTAEPNLKLQVGVLRDGKKLNFDVTPRPAPQQLPQVALALQNLPGLRGGAGVSGPFFEAQTRAGGAGTLGDSGERRIEIHTLRDGPDDGTRFRDMEFATLSEKLGSYFGVKSGVLVVRAGANSPFKLQDGDVILAVDGRELTSAQHAGRVLRSYGDGEKLKLRVQRDRKAQDIEITMPSDRGAPPATRMAPGGGGRGDGRDRND